MPFQASHGCDARRRPDIEATHVHRILQSLLGLAVPVYHHHRLIVDEADKRLSGNGTMRGEPSNTA